MGDAKKPTYRLTWSREPDEKGLAAVCQGERGRVLKVNGKQVGIVSAHRSGGYYFYVRDDELEIPWRNTAMEPAVTRDEAIAACAAYVRKALAEKSK